MNGFPPVIKLAGVFCFWKNGIAFCNFNISNLGISISNFEFPIFCIANWNFQIRNFGIAISNF